METLGRVPVPLPDPSRRAALRARLLAEYGATRNQPRHLPHAEERLDFTVFATSLGWVGVVISERGVVALNLPRPTLEAALARVLAEYPHARLLPEDEVAGVVLQIRQYLDGKRATFQVAIDLSGHTPFQLRVWETALGIPYGETRSYAWVAQQIGKPRAARAVGQALGANPVPMIVPCHRVLASDGSLGGYGGGLPMKERLLTMEGAWGQRAAQ
ncbi:MAG: methylated-DNA--[protein]-cysteine S-methyltransferase [Anaerolineae bacterium]|nr:methylated-DNA--[protein]-cysteine S-methyltransferase [Anaerolineae bacterium]